jgi:hypothetical protein
VRQHLFAALLALALPDAAAAVTVQGSWSLAGDALSGTGLAIRTNRDTGAFALDLADGAETRFRLFRIWTDETDVGEDDRAASAILASFGLDAASASGSIAGTTRGHRALGFQWGTVDWQAPLELDLGHGLLSILLSDETFGRGLLALRNGRRHGADVFANVSYTAGPTVAPVPLPAGLPLALTGLVLLGFAARRRPRPAA